MPEVQEGLVLKVVKKPDNWEVELIPVESMTKRIQPRLMGTGARQSFLEELADRSSSDLRADIAKGRIMLQF